MMINQSDYDAIKEAFETCHDEFCFIDKDFNECDATSCIKRRAILRRLFEGGLNERDTVSS
jgi:hypothetical protein